jgi:hypothetical protein
MKASFLHSATPAPCEHLEASDMTYTVVTDLTALHSTKLLLPVEGFLLQ